MLCAIGLTDQKGSAAAVKRTDEALAGEGPWFFHLDSNLQPSTPLLSEWKKLFASLLSECAAKMSVVPMWREK